MTNMTSQGTGKGCRLNKLESKLQDEQKEGNMTDLKSVSTGPKYMMNKEVT